MDLNVKKPTGSGWEKAQPHHVIDFLNELLDKEGVGEDYPDLNIESMDKIISAFNKEGWWITKKQILLSVINCVFSEEECEEIFDFLVKNGFITQEKTSDYINHKY